MLVREHPESAPASFPKHFSQFCQVLVLCVYKHKLE